MKKQKIFSTILIVVGLILFIVGLSVSVPSEQLTTYKILTYDGEYSYVEEYVGGDAYNYIIAASLVGGKICGAMTQKAIYISVGLIITCFGIFLSIISNKSRSANIDNENL